jgi:hypothetical protein
MNIRSQSVRILVALILDVISASPVVFAAPVSPVRSLMMQAERDWL